MATTMHAVEADLRKVFGKRIPKRGKDEQEFLVAVVKVVGGDKITDEEYESLNDTTKQWCDKAVNGYDPKTPIIGFDDIEVAAPTKKRGKKAAKEEEAAVDDDGEAEGADADGDAEGEGESDDEQETASSQTKTKETKMKATTKTGKRNAPTKKAAKTSAPKAAKKAAAKAPAKKSNGASDTAKARRLICKDLEASSSQIADQAKKAGIDVKYIGALYYHVHSTVDTLRELGKMK